MAGGTGKKHSNDASAQFESFKEAARALECDESEERFDEALKKVARHKPTNEPKAKKPGRKPPSR